MSRCCGFVVQLVVQQIHNKLNKWSLSKPAKWRDLNLTFDLQSYVLYF